MWQLETTMPRRKRPTTAVNEDEKKKTAVHTKRKEILDDEGWTHVVDAPNRKGKAEGLTATPLLHGGDFVLNGVSYITRTLEEVKTEFEYWKKQWEASSACAELQTLLAESEKAERRKVKNVVFLGMGSLQNSRREGRRSSATQLAALQTIIHILGEGMEVVLQDPQFTELDKEFLGSLGYKVVHDPVAFEEVKEGTLVYAIHCYVGVYKAVSAGIRPACLIGTDMGNFGRFESSEATGAITKPLEDMIGGCEVLDFPQVRHDFSDTKIYWGKISTSTPETAKP